MAAGTALEQQQESLSALLDDALDDFEASTASPAQALEPVDGGRVDDAQMADDGSEMADADDDPLVTELAAKMEHLMESISKGDDGRLMRQLEEALAQLDRDAKLTRERAPGASSGGQSEHDSARPEQVERSRHAADRDSPAAGRGDQGDAADFDPSVENTLRLLSRSAEALSSDRDPLAGDGLGSELLRTLADGLDNLGDDDEFASAVEGVMSQLLSKDVMHDPLKQLQLLFGPWMLQHAAELSAEERSRYEAQQLCLDQIIAIFESGDESKQASVVSLLHEMQQHGQPPQEIMKALVPGSDLEGLLDGEGGGKDLPCSVM